MPKTADEVFRDFVVPGDPSSGVHNPSKADIREVIGDVEADRIRAEAAAADAILAATDVQGATMFAATLPSLLANTDTSIPAGTVFATRAEGYSLQVVSSGGHLTTAGGVRLAWRQARKLFVLATGQSNMQQHRAYTWTPVPNVLRWNNVQGDMTSVGNAFVPLTGTTMNPSISFANELARDNPDAVVYLVNVAKGAMTIDSWLPGAPAADDVYSNILANMTPALAAAGVSEISTLLWWQGESGGFESDYPADFEAVQSRFRGNSWFPVRVPTVVFGVTTTARAGEGRYDQTNFVLQDLAAAAGENRQFVNTASLTGATYWEDNVHPSGLGYETVGKMAADAYGGKARFVPYRLRGTAPYLFDANYWNLGTGLYQTDAATLNLPGTFSGTVRNDTWGVNFQVQEVDQITTGKRMRRYRRGGTWGSWYGVNGAVMANTQGAAAQSVVGTTRTVINFPSEVHDPLGLWASGSQFTPHPGLWMLTVAVRLDGGVEVGERLTLQVRNLDQSSLFLSAEVENNLGAAQQVMLSGLVSHTSGGTYVVTLTGTGAGTKTVQLDRAQTYFNAVCIDGA